MENYIGIIICIIALAVIGAVFFIMKKRNPKEKSLEIQASNDSDLISISNQLSSIKLDNLPVLTKDEEANLVEIKNQKIITQIDSIVPGTLQVLANAEAIKKASDIAETAGQLYQAIIPSGAKLVNSKDMEGAFRGFYRDADGIQGHANLIPVEGTSGNGLTAVNIANAAMGVASLIVGQYYMTQINSQLDSINDGLNKITDFQDNEYQSKVLVLAAEVQKSSTFQLETMDNYELRNRELIQLRNLEHECAQLLGQANLTLMRFSDNKNLDYAKYENLVADANRWYQYQQLLIQIMGKISELTYTLNLGTVTRENSYALYLPYVKDAESTLAVLNEWHNENSIKFQIDIEAARRKRQGIDGFFMNVPALFNNDLHYKAISANTASMIKNQSSMAATNTNPDDDLFQKDVRLIVKDGKLYYLPIPESAE